MTTDYVHGYRETEAQRLRDQAQSLTDLLHGDTRYPPGAAVLEAGCGVGAQTVTLLRNSPEARFTAIDLSPGSLEEARRAAQGVGSGAVEFLVADLFALPFPEFDVRPCLRLFRARAPRRPRQGALRGSPGPPARRIPDRNRRRPRVGVLSSRQRIRPAGDRLPGRAAGEDRRRRDDRPPALSAARRGGLWPPARLAAAGLCRRKPPGPDRWIYPQDLHRDDRGRARAGAGREFFPRRTLSTGAWRISCARRVRTACFATRSSRLSR